MMNNAWLVEMVANCQREDALNKAEQHRLCRATRDDSETQEEPQKDMPLLFNLMNLVVR